MIEGRAEFRLKEKLKLMKEKLKWWNKVVFSWIGLFMENTINYLNNFDSSLVQNQGGIISNLVEGR